MLPGDAHDRLTGQPATPRVQTRMLVPRRGRPIDGGSSAQRDAGASFVARVGGADGKVSVSVWVTAG
jgi:hypothetical protein